MVADKAYETGIPQKLGEHANTARDTAAAKYNELTDQVTYSEQRLPALALVPFPRVHAYIQATLWRKHVAHSRVFGTFYEYRP